MAKKEKPVKGEYGYLQRVKKNALGHTLLMVAIGLAIFVLGLLLNKMEATNIFTVFAFLMVLPAAKSFVTVIVTFPYRPITEEKRNRLEGMKRESDELFYNMVFTSTERVMHLDCAYVTGSQIIGYTERKRDDAKKIEEYLKKELEIRQLGHKVYIATEEKQLEKRMALRSEQESFDERNVAPVTEMLRLFII